MRAVDTRALVGLDIRGSRGLEFGPLNRPKVYPDESEIYYLDHASKEDLEKKYQGHVRGPEEEEFQHVHFIADGRPLVEILGDKAPLDYVVASHVIEHIPDVIGWLKDIHAALRVGGVLALWVPDKRFTWDLYRRLTSFREMEQAHAERRSRPGLRVVADHFAYAAEAECWHLWDDYALAEDLPYIHGPEFVEDAARKYAAGEYIDVHCWVFTPWHFLRLMGKITAKYDLGYDLKFFQTTPSHDLQFMVQLEKTAGRSATDWDAEAEAVKQSADWPENGREIAARIGLAV